MTQPVRAWVATTVRLGPSGIARAGAVQPFTNLSSDLDANFTSFKDWATTVQGALTPVIYTDAGWFSPATNWSFALPATGAPNIVKKLGRFAFVDIGLNYAGSIVSSGPDLSPDLLVGTITAPTLRPAVTQHLTFAFYAGVFILGCLQVNTNGTTYITSLSTAPITATNPGIVGHFVWAVAVTS